MLKTKMITIPTPYAVATTLLAVGGVSLCPAPVWAQPLVQGPNRRVDTPQGFVGANVTFTRSGGFNAATIGDKPTFYLGISAPYAIDGGAQFEPKQVGSTGDRTKRMGWSIFMKQPTNPPGSTQGFTQHVGLASGDEVPDSAMGARTIDFSVAPNGFATLSMTGFLPISNPEPLDNGGSATMQIKRVVGITQTIAGGGLSLDGSYMFRTQCTVNNLDQWVAGVSTPTNAWPSNSPAPTYLPAMPQRVGTTGPNAHFIIDMDSPWQRLANGSDQPIHAHTPSRLQQETVNIDLRTVAQVAAARRSSSSASPGLLERLGGWFH